MGQGGFFALINATPHHWYRRDQWSRQMNAWSFPENIEPYTSINIYVEFDERGDTNNTGAEVRYELATEPHEGAHFILTGHFRWLGLKQVGFPLLYGPESEFRPVDGPEWDLGWAHDGYIRVALSGILPDHVHFAQSR